MKRVVLGMLWWCAMLAPDASGQALASPQLRAGEDLKVLYFTIRANYIIPDKVTVEEGWYRIVVDNPHLVATKVAVAVDDERNNRLASKAIAEAAPRTSFFYRVNPGRHKLRIGTKQEWIVQLDVNAKKN